MQAAVVKRKTSWNASTKAAVSSRPPARWTGWRVIAPAGMGIAAIGCLLLTRLDPAVGLAATFPALVILIFGLGSFISPN